MDELTDRLKRGPVSYRIVVQLAAPGDEVNDATVHWPDSREQLEFGTVTLTERVNELDPEMRKIIFDPRPRIDGIEAYRRLALRSPRRALPHERPPPPRCFRIALRRQAIRATIHALAPLPAVSLGRPGNADRSVTGPDRLVAGRRSTRRRRSA